MVQVVQLKLLHIFTHKKTGPVPFFEVVQVVLSIMTSIKDISHNYRMLAGSSGCNATI